MCEVYAPRRGDGFFGRVERLGHFEFPGSAPVETSGEYSLVGFVAVDGVAVLAFLVVSEMKADQDFIAPDPDAVVCGPAAEGKEPVRMPIMMVVTSNVVVSAMTVCSFPFQGFHNGLRFTAKTSPAI